MALLLGSGLIFCGIADEFTVSVRGSVRANEVVVAAANT
jgi:hypothetical protein